MNFSVAAAGSLLRAAFVAATAIGFAVALPAVDAAQAAAVPTHGLAGSYLAGRHAERVRDYPAAIEFLSRTLEADSENLDVLRQLFLLTVAEGQMDHALALAPRVQKVAPTEPLPPMIQLLDRFRAGDHEASLQIIAESENYGLNQIVMPFVEAWSLAGLGRGEEALAVLAGEQAPTGLAPLYATHRGLLHEFLGDAAAAEAEYQAAIAMNETASYAPIAALGALYERTGRAEEARAVYTDFADSTQSHRMIEPALARLDGTDGGEIPNRAAPSAAVSDLLFSVASSLSQEGNEIFAYVFGRMSLFLDAENGLALALVAQSLQAQERHEEAIEIYRTVPLTSPMGFASRLAMADAMNAFGRVDEAISYLEELAATYTDDYAPLAAIGNYLRAEERFAEAVEAYDRAFERIPEVAYEHWSLLYYRGIALERSGQWDRAEADFLKALEFEPEQPFVLNYLGYSWVEQGKNLDEARTMIETAVKQRPGDGFIVDSLGWVLYRLGQYEEAVPHLERAVELEPADPVINDHLGDALWQVGRRLEAQYQWQRASELEPDEELAARIADKLANGLTNPPEPVVDEHAAEGAVD
jgi:Flp pilus assembly protein TadD